MHYRTALITLMMFAGAAFAHGPSEAPHQTFPLGDFKWESGEAIRGFSISYVTHGTLNANVRVSAGVGSSGCYGHIDINNYPQPVVINPQPVIVQQQPVYVEPVYVRAPEWHRAHWHHYCGVYQACGRPVYFVQEGWYHNVYGPRYMREYGRDRGRNGGHERELGRRSCHEERRL